jgi:hypothetical protein
MMKRIVVIALIVVTLVCVPASVLAVTLHQADAYLGWSKTGSFDVSSVTVGETITVRASFAQTSCAKPVRGNPTRIVGMRFSASGGNAKGSALNFAGSVAKVFKNGQLIKGQTLASDRNIFGVAELVYRFDEPISLVDSDSVELIATDVKVNLAAKSFFRLSSLHEPGENEKKWAKNEGRDIWYIEGKCPGISSESVEFFSKSVKKEAPSPVRHSPTSTPTSSPTQTPTPTIGFLQPKPFGMGRLTSFWNWADNAQKETTSTSQSTNTPARGFRAIWEAVFSRK